MAMWIGAMLVACFTDVEDRVLHMTGVGILFLAAAVHMCCQPTWSRLVPFAWAVGIWLLRILVRSLVILLFDPALNIHGGGGLLSIVVPLVQRTQALMERGELALYAHHRSVAWPWIEPTLQVCAVLQWASLFALSCVL